YSTISVTAADRDWQVAQQRVLLYLQTLRTPAPKTLELALEAFKRAGDKSYRGVHPASDTMRALRGLMSEYCFNPIESCFGQQLGEGNTVSKGISPMPPLTRGSMVPEEIDRRPWFSSIARCLKKLEPAASRLGVARILYLLLLLTVLIIVFLNTWD
ncbi:MAG: hypothetical protein V2A69_15700, partial [Pseudomonadota bacterium]